MEANWVTALDNLAAGGVIDFDAAAFLLDKPARFVGHPGMESLPLVKIDYLPKGTKLKDVPKMDVYQHPEDGEFVHNPTWKKALTGTVLGAGALLIGLTVLSKFVKLPFKVPKLTGWSMPKLRLPKLKMPKIKLPKVKMPKFSNIVSGLKNFGKKVLNYIKKPVSFIASKIKRLHI